MGNETEIQFLEINDNKRYIVCDASAVFLFSRIYPLLASGADEFTLRQKIMSAGTSVPEDYFRGAVGLLLLAIDKKANLLINPTCLK